jgi:hypothetical protein
LNKEKRYRKQASIKKLNKAGTLLDPNRLPKMAPLLKHRKES